MKQLDPVEEKRRLMSLLRPTFQTLWLSDKISSYQRKRLVVLRPTVDPWAPLGSAAQWTWCERGFRASLRPTARGGGLCLHRWIRLPKHLVNFQLQSELLTSVPELLPLTYVNNHISVHIKSKQSFSLSCLVISKHCEWMLNFWDLSDAEINAGQLSVHEELRWIINTFNHH